MLKLEIENIEELRAVCHALSTTLRLQILQLLQSRRLSCLELSRLLHCPLSTITANVKILENANLVLTETVPAKNGYQRICSIVYNEIYIYFAEYLKKGTAADTFEIDIPIGSYMSCDISPTCGLVTPAGDSLPADDPSSFYHPIRLDAGLLWFRKGWLEYNIPFRPGAEKMPKEIRISAEMCSEAPGYNLDWKSDITMWINGVEVGTWLSPADFGGTRGTYTPAFWALQNTQYGILTRWVIGAFDTEVNYEKVSGVNVSDLSLSGGHFTLRLGVKEDAPHAGGLNLFGREFGNHPQGIALQLVY